MRVGSFGSKPLRLSLFQFGCCGEGSLYVYTQCSACTRGRRGIQGLGTLVIGATDASNQSLHASRRGVRWSHGRRWTAAVRSRRCRPMCRVLGAVVDDVAGVTRRRRIVWGASMPSLRKRLPVCLRRTRRKFSDETLPRKADYAEAISEGSRPALPPEGWDPTCAGGRGAQARMAAAGKIPRCLFPCFHEGLRNLDLLDVSGGGPCIPPCNLHARTWNPRQPGSLLRALAVLSVFPWKDGRRRGRGEMETSRPAAVLKS